MRIAIANWSGRRAGGVEGYLEALGPALMQAGHEVSFVSEATAPVDRAPIDWPSRGPAWCVEESGPEQVLSALRKWRPDVLHLHAIHDVNFEERLQELAPTVFFAHQYHGTCVSGTKTWSFPSPRVCTRRFGPPCLLHFYPHRCGGLSPLTMARDYRVQARRLELLRRYRFIATHSNHMREEYIRHGFTSERVRKIPFLLRPFASTNRAAADPRQWRLLFVGRMERLKGGHILLEALPRAQARLDRPLHLTLIGDGRERGPWEQAAGHARATEPRLTIEFAGWLDPLAVDRRYATADLLVMPSLWPEPFGQAGPEAGQFGVPAAAFAVGGIPEWLQDGANGHLAPGDPPTADGLADAIVRCLQPAARPRLMRCAAELAARYLPIHHIPALTEIFERARTS